MPQLPLDYPCRCHKMPQKCHNATLSELLENERCDKCHKCHIEKGVRMYLSLIDKKEAPGRDTSIPEASDMI